MTAQNNDKFVLEKFRKPNTNYHNIGKAYCEKNGINPLECYGERLNGILGARIRFAKEYIRGNYYSGVDEPELICSAWNKHGLGLHLNKACLQYLIFEDDKINDLDIIIGINEYADDVLWDRLKETYCELLYADPKYIENQSA